MSLYNSIVITGGKGMLAHAIKTLLDARGLKYASVDIDTHDLTKPADVQRLFEQYRPTLLINPAAYTAVDKCETNRELADAINGHAVGTLAQHAKQQGTKLVHISTDFVFDGSKRTPYLTSDTPNPVSAYGHSKLLGEQKLQEVNPPGWIIARTAWLYGPNGASFPKAILTAARAGKPLKVVSDQQGCPTYTFDMAAGLLNLIDVNASGIFHLVNSGETTWFGFTQAILEEFEVKAELTPITAADWAQLRPDSAARPAYSVLDTSDYTRATSKLMRPWRDGLRDFKTTGA